MSVLVSTTGPGVTSFPHASVSLNSIKEVMIIGLLVIWPKEMIIRLEKTISIEMFTETLFITAKNYNNINVQTFRNGIVHLLDIM